MRTLIAGVGVCIALAGCATYYSPAQLATAAKAESTPNLCAIALMAPPLRVLNAAENEIAARGAKCDWDQARAIASTQMERQQAQREEQQQRNAMLLGLSAALLQQSGPRPYSSPPPMQTSCIQQGVFLNCSSY